MSKNRFDDETLMAFADGELDEEQSLALEKALEQDDALAERLAVFLDSRTIVSDALKPLIDEPVPDALVAKVAAISHGSATTAGGVSNVAAFRPKAAARAPARTLNPWLLPLAASLVAVISGISGFSIGQIISENNAFEQGVASVLDREVSGQDIPLAGSGRVLHIIASFRDEAGALCREYELKDVATSTLSVSCQDQDRAGWSTRFALTQPITEGYAPASSQEVVGAYLTTINAGTPLSQEEELAALKR